MLQWHGFITGISLVGLVCGFDHLDVRLLTMSSMQLRGTVTSSLFPSASPRLYSTSLRVLLVMLS
jgi:hypothetical protein